MKKDALLVVAELAKEKLIRICDQEYAALALLAEEACCASIAKVAQLIRNTDLTDCQQQQPMEKSWEWPVNTVGKLIANLQTLPPAMPFYTAYFVDIDGKRIARATHPSFSRETVGDNRRIEKYDADNQSLIGWATAYPAPDQEKAKSDE